MGELASLQAIVYGMVQGVFFRAFVSRVAGELDLTGYVRNRPGGSVEVNAEGDRGKLEELVSHLEVGSPSAVVERVDTNWSEYSGSYSGFRVKY